MILPLALTFLQHVMIFLFILISLLLILVVLVQKGKGGGVGAAFGGMGGASSLLGTKTGDFLTWVTITMVALFLVLSVIMGVNLKPKAPTPSMPAGTNAVTPEGTTGAEAQPGEPQGQAQPATPAEGQDEAAPANGMEGTAEQMTRDVPQATKDLMEGAQQEAEQQAGTAQDAPQQAPQETQP